MIRKSASELGREWRKYLKGFFLPEPGKIFRELLASSVTCKKPLDIIQAEKPMDRNNRTCTETVDPEGN